MVRDVVLSWSRIIRFVSMYQRIEKDLEWEREREREKERNGRAIEQRKKNSLDGQQCIY